MSLSPETLPRHELVGLHVRVAESSDPTRVGIEGRVVRETMRTVVVRTESGERVVPKAGSTLEFRLDDEPSTSRPDRTDEAAAGLKAAGTASEPVSGTTHTAGDGVAYVTVDGAMLLSRPARRTESGVDSKWQ